MGDEPTESEIGVLCEECWGEGEPYDAHFTPKYVVVVFTGLEKNPDPLCDFFPNDFEGLTIICQQEEGTPCLWKGSKLSDKPPATWDASWWVVGGHSILEGRVSGGFVFFLHNRAVKCMASFTNQTPPGGCIAGGSASVS